jgi:isopenicillin N synthase-like dioxygenase
MFINEAWWFVQEAIMQDNIIPTIDLEPFRGGSLAARQKEVRRLGLACENTGFFVVSGHGVPPALLQAGFNASAEFFSQPDEVKRQSQGTGRNFLRGYRPVGSNTTAKSIGIETPADYRELFYMGPVTPSTEDDLTAPGGVTLFGENIWPDTPRSFRPALTELYTVLEGVAFTVMRAMALALDLPESYFEKRIDRHFSTVTTMYYPRPTVPFIPGQLRCGPHTDYGSVTILARNEAPGGLQVQAQNGDWHDVRATPGQFVVNIGDMMARWTNDKWKSTMHRVANPPPDVAGDTTRQSLGFFLHPNYQTEVKCIETCTDDAHPARYAPQLAGRLMWEKFERRAGSY